MKSYTSFREAHGVQGVLEGKWVFELAYLYLEHLIFLPFSKQVYHSWAAAQVGCVAIKLYLGFPVEISSYAAFECNTRHADVEGIGFCAFLSNVLILSHAVARQFQVVQP